MQSSEIKEQYTRLWPKMAWLILAIILILFIVLTTTFLSWYLMYAPFLFFFILLGAVSFVSSAPIWTLIVIGTLLFLLTFVMKKNWPILSKVLVNGSTRITIVLILTFLLTALLFWIFGGMSPVLFLVWERSFLLICILLTFAALIFSPFVTMKLFHRSKVCAFAFAILLLEISLVSQGAMLRNIVSPTLKISESVSPYNAKLTVVHYSKQADPLDPPSGPCYFVIERSNEIPFLLYEGKYDDSKPCLGDYEQEITWINATTIQTGGSVFHLPSDF